MNTAIWSIPAAVVGVLIASRIRGRTKQIARPSRAMNAALRGSFEAELLASRTAESGGHFERAWRSLERAHVLSQFHAGPHVRVHLKMAAFAWRRVDVRELIGQLPRLLLAAPGSWTGRAPLGNTGGSDVGIFTPMQIPEDLQSVLDRAAV
jgi:hypothetical protein